MSFKGKQNLEGRRKGCANKIKTKVKETIAEILDDNLIELKNRIIICLWLCKVLYTVSKVYNSYSEIYWYNWTFWG